MLPKHPKSRGKPSKKEPFDFIKSAARARLFYIVINTLLKVLIKYFPSIAFLQILEEFIPLTLYQTVVRFDYELFFPCIPFVENVQFLAVLRQLNVAVKLALSLHSPVQRIIVLEAFYFFGFETFANHIGRGQIRRP